MFCFWVPSYIRSGDIVFLKRRVKETFCTYSARDARARLAGLCASPYREHRILKTYVSMESDITSRFHTKELPLSTGVFNTLAWLILGKMPVQRTNGSWWFRRPLNKFGDTWFGKRCCLHCLLHSDTLVLDSEWHWIFDCPQFDEFRAKRPLFFKNLESAQDKMEFATLGDLCRLLVATRNDSRIGFSLASFLRQARLARKSWLEEVCAGGRLSVPPHWTHDIFLDPPSDAEFVEDFEELFNDGMPFHASAGMLVL